MSRKTRLLLIMDFIFGVTGGTENQVVKLINGLDQNRYEMHLFCLKQTDWLKENTAKLACSVKAYGYDVFNHKNPGNLVAFLKLIRDIRRVSPDVIMCFFRVSYILGVLAGRLAGVRNIISTRRDFGLWIDESYVYFLRFANRFVSAIVTNSHRVRELVIEREGFDPGKVIVIHNGIENGLGPLPEAEKTEIRTELGISPGNKVIGLVAGLRPMKRHETFLKGARHVLDRRQDVSFLVIGDGPLRAKLERRAAELGLQEHMAFLGWKEDVRPYLSIMDIGVNCSANEGLSNAIMEYMQCGVPCVVSDAGGNSELIENGVNGWMFRLDDDSELARLILELMDDPASREMFSAESRKRIAAEFDLDRMVRDYEQLFSRMPGRGSTERGKGSRATNGALGC